MSNVTFDLYLLRSLNGFYFLGGKAKSTKCRNCTKFEEGKNSATTKIVNASRRAKKLQEKITSKCHGKKTEENM